MRPSRAWWSERAETTVPAILVGCSPLLDALAEDTGRAVTGLALAVRVVAGVLCAVFALRGLGRFGDSPLARRFSLWRACGLLAAGACVGLQLLVRWPALLQPTDGGFALDVVGMLWILLTGSVWGRPSWERLADQVEREEAAPATPAVLGWPGLGTAP